MSKEKMARRKAAGDDPTAKSQSNASFNGAPPAQPMKNMEQGKGNLMNNPQVGQSMGGGAPQPGGPGMFPYNDGGVGMGDHRLGAIGFAPPSQMNQNQKNGLMNNRNEMEGMLRQPTSDTMNMMDSLYNMQQTTTRAQKLYADKDGQPTHVPSPMGMLGMSMESGMQNPGQVPFNQPQQMPNTLTPTSGMDLGRGGGRNKQSQA